MYVCVHTYAHDPVKQGEIIRLQCRKVARDCCSTLVRIKKTHGEKITFLHAVSLFRSYKAGATRFSQHAQTVNVEMERPLNNLTY